SSSICYLLVRRVEPLQGFVGAGVVADRAQVCVGRNPVERQPSGTHATTHDGHFHRPWKLNDPIAWAIVELTEAVWQREVVRWCHMQHGHDAPEQLRTTQR